MINELDRVVLTTDLPEYLLKIGDIGTVVLIHQEGKGYEVELMILTRETIAIASLFNYQIKAIATREIAQARVLV
jgi:Domain of unknown function (DUF4926)